MGCRVNFPGEKVGEKMSSFHTRGRRRRNGPLETGVIPFKCGFSTLFSPRKIEKNVLKRYITARLLVPRDP
jgi:hypothetical protein